MNTMQQSHSAVEAVTHETVGTGSDLQGEWNREVDVVVIGAGPGGMTAAIVADAEGLETLLIEKTDQVGGTGAWSAGMMWFVDTAPMRTAGFEDSPEKARAYFDATVGNAVPHALRDAYIEQGSVALDYMVRHSELRVIAVDYPDYYPEFDGGMFGRAHAPLEFDGRTLGGNFKNVRGSIPAFAPLGGMMLDLTDLHHFMAVTRSFASFRHIVKRLARHAIDRLSHHRGTRLVAGNALVARLYKTILDRRIDTWLQAAPEKLVLKDGRVIGVEVLREGKVVRVHARRGVVIATGGYSGNMAMRREHSRAPTVERALDLPTNIGEGIALAQSVGARLDRSAIDTGYYAPVSELDDGKGGRKLWAHFMMDRPKPGFIAVGADGRRFTNEAASYHAFTLGMFEANAIPAWLVADAAAVKKYGIGVILPGGMGIRKHVNAGYLFSGRTLAELAGRIGVDPINLERSAAAMNRYAASGVDDEFGKGSTGYNRFKGDAAHQPNACLGPIAKPPFYAVKMMPGDFGTSRGLVTNGQAQVLDADSQPIAGLYACGNDMNSPVGGRYIGAGITLGPAITFGYLAAMAMAQDVSTASPQDYPNAATVA